MVDKIMIHICDTADVTAAHGYKVDVKDIGTLAVFFFEGAYFVVDDKCTHGLGSLSDGKISGDQIICPFHRGAFNFRTGLPTARPCTIALKTYQAHMVGSALYIDNPVFTV
jgi:nitrite reductase/ring-hydroxylating ferredoxin subunit